MNTELFRGLLSSQGQAAITEAVRLAPSEKTFLADIKKLEKSFSRDLSRAALEVVLLRKKAQDKFSRAERMYFTREALEQSSGEVIATYRAERFVNFSRIGDFGCGIGGDTIGLARKGSVLAVDKDSLRLGLAAENLKVYELAEKVQFREADLTAMDFPDVEAIFFDPSRRDKSRRYLSGRDYQPSLEIVHRWLAHTPAIAVKIAPGISWSEIDSFDCEAEFISVQGELKECLLLFGPLKTNKRRATVLPLGATFTGEDFPKTGELKEAQAYLYEPDPAILRAGLVAQLAHSLQAYQLDEDIAFLTSENAQPTPFAQIFQIEDAFPFHLKKLRERLRVLGVGTVVVKKRGSAVDLQMLIRQLKLTGPKSRGLFLTRVRGRPFVLVGQPGCCAATKSATVCSSSSSPPKVIPIESNRSVTIWCFGPWFRSAIGLLLPDISLAIWATSCSAT